MVETEEEANSFLAFEKKQSLFTVFYATNADFLFIKKIIAYKTLN